MRFVISVNYTPEIACRGFTDGTEIEMDAKKDCDEEPDNQMDQVGPVKTADA
jgi:hypothetical protein